MVLRTQPERPITPHHAMASALADVLPLKDLAVTRTRRHKLSIARGPRRAPAFFSTASDLRQTRLRRRA
jgi:hypothetical protein